MAFNSIPVGERLHIGFFGCRNVGKSSVVNAVTGQELSVVSDVKGTTTDPVKKAMELLPLGPVVIIDTPGFDDEGELGEKRVATTKKILKNCDIAVLVTVAGKKLNNTEKELISIFQKREIPYIIVKNKVDMISTISEENVENYFQNVVYTSALDKKGIEELKNNIGNLAKNDKTQINFVGDFIKPKDVVVLVTPIDSGAPKGRMILPQQQAIRDILDFNGIPIVTKETELKKTLDILNVKPSLVITDSQIFKKVDGEVSKDIPLTSFSILMARYKGFLDVAVNGAKQIENLKDGSRILISEGCTHHRQCDDIGTVKFPKWITNYTNKKIEFEWSSRKWISRRFREI